jgi:hypothetical protein
VGTGAGHYGSLTAGRRITATGPALRRSEVTLFLVGPLRCSPNAARTADSQAASHAVLTLKASTPSGAGLWRFSEP